MCLLRVPAWYAGCVVSGRPSFYDSGGPAGEPRMAVALLLVFLAGCGSPEPAPTPELAPVAIDDPFAAPLADLRAAALRHATRAAEQPGEASGVEAALRASELARVLSIRDADGAWLDRSRTWLREASRDPSIAGACEAASRGIDLEARDAADPTAAVLLAYVTSLRFGQDTPCAQHARQVMTTLAPWRPSDTALQAMREDLGVPAPEAASNADGMAAWARRNADGEAAEMSGLAVIVPPVSEGEVASVRVVLRFDRVVSFEHGEAPASGSAPRRTWLELASVSPADSVLAETGVSAGGLRSVGVAARGGNTRVSFRLDEEARFRVFALPEPFRIVVDFEPGGPQADGPVQRVMLDPGHGGDDFGARAYGMRESDLTLDLSRRARVLLARRLPDVQVLLTREDDTFVSLEQRVAMANAVSADLFVSVHLNAADEEVDRGGVTTFVLDTSNDRQALRLAARENGTSVSEVGSISHLLASLHREEQVRESRGLAEQIHRATLAGGRSHLPGLHDRGVRSAMFYVLVGARMPAVLLEASFLSQAQEAEALRESAYRQALAEGLVDGIVRYVGG
ncbi:MAG: N-acetylmuramoyl-L-alanine amidase [Sandaracinaceae bacterium]